jgi:hypothetical protein
MYDAWRERLEDVEYASIQRGEILATGDDIFVFLLIDAFMLPFSLIRE